MTHHSASGHHTPFLGAALDGVRGHAPQSGNLVDKVIDPFGVIAGRSSFDDLSLVDIGQHLLNELCAA